LRSSERPGFGGEYAEIPVDRSVRAMREILARLTIGDPAQFRTWEGEQHPW